MKKSIICIALFIASFSASSYEPSFLQSDLQTALNLQTICNGVDRYEADGSIVEFYGNRMSPDFYEILKVTPSFEKSLEQLESYVRNFSDGARVIVEEQSDDYFDVVDHNGACRGGLMGIRARYNIYVYSLGIKMEGQASTIQSLFFFLYPKSVAERSHYLFIYL